MVKGTDYSASAESLTNPESVRLLLLTRLGLNSRIEDFQNELNMRNTDLLASINILNRDLAANETEIRNTVLADGGYQDVDAGLYALRQKRVSIEYNVKAFRRDYPQYAPAVIKEVVDPVAIAGLIKGKLIFLTDMLRPDIDPPVAKENVSFVFIIRAEPATEVKKELKKKWTSNKIPFNNP